MRLPSVRSAPVIASAVAVLGAVVAIVFWLALPAEPAPETGPPPDAPTGEQAEPTASNRRVIGRSVKGRDIEAYAYGAGAKHLVFVGGIHGGYEWNSVVLAYQFMDYLQANPNAIPANLKVTVIPSANPDGVFEVIGKEGRFAAADVPGNPLPAGTGRFNANGVDLNRNFACRWQPQSTWRGQPVSAGSAPFSEPEAAAIGDFAVQQKPDAVVFWHSQASAVYASECGAGILPVTRDIMNAYARASGYRAVESFDAYPVTGDSESWLASMGIPAITVELRTHETVEWEKNLAGARALFEYFDGS
jgi:predicted deacylase